MNELQQEIPPLTDWAIVASTPPRAPEIHSPKEILRMVNTSLREQHPLLDNSVIQLFQQEQELVMSNALPETKSDVIAVVKPLSSGELMRHDATVCIGDTYYGICEFQSVPKNLGIHGAREEALHLFPSIDS